MMKKEKGLFIVEFAIIAVILFVILVAVMELARIIWIWNTLDEATRRGARVAAVCTVDDSEIVKRVTIFSDSGNTSPILKGLETGAVTVSYLKEDGDPSTGNFQQRFEDTRFVRVAVNAGNTNKYTVNPLIPFIGEWTPPTFETTIPSESLGLVPNPADPADIQFDCLMPK
jgi:Flp pilus assembly protein TadG